ncbi:hypothetical protein [uncultured Cyclobacterium sp.]|uniref:hypothetical protein n=1 Tax=uncultured Cyclobacterium sp. TaxID=453820 RepID=UPI0030EF999B|tara:strand:- start:57729 stop:59099 length:1371 start_codon:yes stop_codon:yes gene_type:complete
MINFNPIRTISAFAILGLAACSTGYQASNMGGEVDNLYFMASDSRIATEFAVKNNNPENFKEIEQIRDIDGDVENFSARNVNPEYIAKYQRSATPAAEESTVYFDDSQSGTNLATGDPNINAYDNYTGSNGSGSVTNNNFFMNPMMGYGMSSMMMGGMYNPYFGSGFGRMGFYDPFYSSGFGFNSGFGFRPGFNLSLGMGFGFGNPYFGRGFGMYDPFMNYGYGYRPGFGGLYGGGYYPPVIVLPGGSEGNRRQVVQGARGYRSSSLANSNASSRSRSIASPTSSRATARRDALSNNSSAVSRNRSSATNNSFSRSQNDYYNSASATPARRNINSPAMNRAGNTSTRSSYGNTRNSSTYRSAAPSSNSRSRSINSTNSRSQYAAPRSNSRSSSPSYNRSRSTRTTTPTYQQRSTTPSRSSTYSAPSRSSSTYSAPRSSGGSSRSTGSSSSGSRRGN